MKTKQYLMITIEFMVDFLKKPLNVIFLGTIITVIGAIITGYGTYKQNKSSSARNERIESGVNEGIKIGIASGSNIETVRSQNIVLSSKVEEQNRTIDSLRQENVDLHGKLQEASKTIFDNIKGGQEAIYLEAVRTDKDHYQFWINNSNDYPVYGLTFELIDYDKLILCKSVVQDGKYIVDYPCYRKLSIGFDKPQLEVGQFYIAWGNPLLGNIINKDQGRYQIRFRMRDKTFYQQLIYKKTNEEVYTASRIFETKNSRDNHSNFLNSKTISPDTKSWIVDFDKEFPTGLIIDLAPL